MVASCGSATSSEKAARPRAPPSTLHPHLPTRRSGARENMTAIQRVAIISGAIFVLVSLAGFTPVGMGMMQMDGGTGMLLGRFPVNALHNVVHLLFGVWGLWAGRTTARALTYALGSGAAYLILGVLGLFTSSLLGVIPIGGYDVYLHLFLAVALAGCGGFWALWLAPQGPVPARDATTAP